MQSRGLWLERGEPTGSWQDASMLLRQGRIAEPDLQTCRPRTWVLPCAQKVSSFQGLTDLTLAPGWLVSNWRTVRKVSSEGIRHSGSLVSSLSHPSLYVIPRSNFGLFGIKFKWLVSSNHNEGDLCFSAKGSAPEPPDQRLAFFHQS